MRRLEFSMHPSSMKEWLGLAALMSAVVFVFAVVARGDAFRGVVVFWYAWSGLALSVAFHIARRGAFLVRGRSTVSTWVDKILLTSVQAFGLAAFVALSFRR
ncbi:hypothetical protein [Vitiosangium sp. GDMCC 1.1324]|uniref:hypothetical protein n=1 Tax=Vitiosangium sp. (strain GDMCC 1.1324) TaxID=2138576 RepID=UPI000D375B3A|nr:hypothetical protein [Vitiosangium sp. GDMCC 1.1324]PTL81850.1 hypothetical protein DAT35_23260 [Vitiosangium sp. GDMCC 1.1324]